MKIPAPQGCKFCHFHTRDEWGGGWNRTTCYLGFAKKYAFAKWLAFPETGKFWIPPKFSNYLTKFLINIICHVYNLGVFGTLNFYSVGGGGTEYFKYIVCGVSRFYPYISWVGHVKYQSFPSINSMTFPIKILCFLDYSMCEQGGAALFFEVL